MSKGEEKIEKFLIQQQLPFKREVSFPHLVGKNKQLLRYDFAIYYNNQVAALIEIDGEPHFIYIPFFDKNRSSFERRKGRDRKKNEYAIIRKIPLFRIPYWELDNINCFEDIIQDKFKVYSVYHNDRLIRQRGKI